MINRSGQQFSMMSERLYLTSVQKRANHDQIHQPSDKPCRNPVRSRQTNIRFELYIYIIIVKYGGKHISPDLRGNQILDTFWQKAFKEVRTNFGIFY